MSQWFDQSNNANKLRQSYVKGFLDISGGGVYIRSDNSLNLYTKADGVTPAFGMDATNYRVKGIGRASDTPGTYTDVSMNKLAYLLDLSDNVQDQIDYVIDKVKYLNNDASNNQTVLQLNGSDPNNKELVVWGNIVPGEAEAYDIGSAEKPFNSIYLKNNTIYFDTVTGGDTDPAGAMSFNTDTGRLDISYNGTNGSTVIAYDNKVGLNIADPTNATAELDLSGTLKVNGQVIVETGDISLNDNLFVGSDASLNANLYVKSATLLDSTLTVSQDTSLNANLYLGGDASLNSKLYVQGATTLDSTLIVTQDATLSSGLIVTSDASLNSQLYVQGATTLDSTINVMQDASLNANLYVANDVSLNSKLYVEDATTLNSTLNVLQDASLNANLYVANDVSLNSKLYVKQATTLDSTLSVTDVTILQSTLEVQNDVSLNTNLHVGGDASFNKNLYVDGETVLNADVSMNSNLDIGGNLVIKGNLSVFQTRDTTTINTKINNYEIIVTQDLSLNGGLSMSGDASLNAGLVVLGDVSFNGKMSVGDDVSLNKNLQVGEDITQFAGFLVQY
jgi:UDP-3-O-[3-hydroxymyristoyl] glucosamine N-acyltransferase